MTWPPSREGQIMPSTSSSAAVSRPSGAAQTREAPWQARPSWQGDTVVAERAGQRSCVPSSDRIDHRSVQCLHGTIHYPKDKRGKLPAVVITPALSAGRGYRNVGRCAAL